MKPDFEGTKFFGDGYDPLKDKERLTGQLGRVFDVLYEHRHEWLSLSQISMVTDAPEASASAAMRTLRNQYGFIIDKKRRTEKGGTWLYKITGQGQPRPVISKEKPAKYTGNSAKYDAMLAAIQNHVKASGDEASVTRENLKSVANEWLKDMVQRAKVKDF